MLRVDDIDIVLSRKLINVVKANIYKYNTFGV